MKIVFDFAGVVFHWQPNAMLQRVLPKHAADEAGAAYWVQQLFQSWGGDWTAFDRGMIEAPALAAKIAARTGLPEHDVRRVIDAIPHELRPDADTLALMDELRDEGHALYFLSNMPAPYAEHLESAHPLQRWFRAGIFSSRAKLIKPEPAIFALAARHFEARPDELLFIDDVLHNVQAARAAGWQALQYLNALQCRQELRERCVLEGRPPPA